jgi:hypothetical protein
MVYMGHGFHIDDYQGLTFASKSVGISTWGSNSSPRQEMFAVTNQDLTSKNRDFNRDGSVHQQVHAFSPTVLEISEILKKHKSCIKNE